MKTDWNIRPDNWNASRQIATALLCVAPALGAIAIHQNLVAIVLSICAIGFWCWLGRATQGFPLLFDMLGLTVFSINGLAVLIGTIRLIRSRLLH